MRIYGPLLALPWIVIIAATAVTAGEVSATRLDGTAIVGELQSWDDNQIAIRTSAGEQNVATDQVIFLRWSPTATPHPHGQNSAMRQMELIDGTILPIDAFNSAGDSVTATLAGSMPSNAKTLSLDRSQLAAVRLQPLDTAAAEHWDDIRSLSLASDVLVVMKPDGKSLDHVEGVLGDVSDDKIEFKLDGKPGRIDRAKVAGFILYRGSRQVDAQPRCTVHGRSGLRANVSRAQLVDDILRLKTLADAELSWPLDDVYLADFSAGKLLYLSDIEAASERWTPLVGLPAGAELAAEYGKPRRDKSAYGGPLTLSSLDAQSVSPIGRERQFSKGLALRSRTEMVYRLPAGFHRFTALAGIDPTTSASGHVRFVIYADDRPILETEIGGHEPARTIDLDIAGVKRLKIVVDYGHNLDTGDWLNLCDARIVK